MTRFPTHRSINGSVSDASLLRRFLRDRDESAFAELVRRYGPLVFGVCRRLIADRHLAEDAFQAAFLVLARKSEGLRSIENLASWLYGVAFKVALRARTMTGRRAKRETLTDEVPETPAYQNPPDDSVAILDEAISALPALYREAVVLCELQGVTRRDAAKQLGIQQGTLSSRLAKARKLLAENLSKRGLALTAVLTASAIITPTLFAATVRGATGVAPRAVTALADGVTRIMLLSKLKLTVGLALVALLSLGFGMGGFSNSVALTAAPVPKAVKDEGVLWMLDPDAGKLIAYTPEGKEAKAVVLMEKKIDPKLFLGLSAHGQFALFVGSNGAYLNLDEFGVIKPTVHLLPLHETGKLTDTGIDYDINNPLIPDAFTTSPDGEFLFRCREVTKPGAERGTWAVTQFDRTGKNAKEIALPDHKWLNAVLPNGDFLLEEYVSGRERQTPLYRWTPGDHKPLMISGEVNVCDPAMSPDGKTLLATAQHLKSTAPPNGEFSKLVSIDPATGKATDAVAREKTGGVKGCWSPDGKHIAVQWHEWVEAKPKPLDGGLRYRRWGGGDVSISNPDGSGGKVILKLDDPGDDHPGANSPRHRKHLLGWFPTKPKIFAPIPKEKPMEWRETKPIELDGGGRITSVAYSPSGKTLAVCRDNGMIDFYDPATRKHQQSMNFLGDPKSNPKREVGTYPAIAFRPTPHAKLGDVFAITHKNGVNFGTTNIGLIVDDGPAVEDLPGNSENKDFDPQQVAWLADDSMVATNGAEEWWRVKVKGGWESQDWTIAADGRGRRVPFAALPGQSLNFVTIGAGRNKESELQIVSRAPQSSPQTRLPGHKSRPISAVVSADGKRIVSVDEGGTIIVWEGENLEFKEKSRIEIGPGVVQLALAPDGKTLAVLRTTGIKLLGAFGGTGTDLSLFVFDITDPPKEPKALWTSDVLFGKFTGPASLAFSPEGTTLLAAFGDPFPETTNQKERGAVMKSLGVKVWELGTKIAAPIPKEKEVWKETKPIQFDTHPHGDRITGIDCSSDGKFLAVAVGEQVRLLDAETRKMVNEHALTAKVPGAITGVAFSPKGDKLAMTAKDFVCIYSKLGKSPSVSSDSSWKCDGFDSHRVAWLSNDALVATNGNETRYRNSAGKEQAYTWLPENQHRASILAPIPGKNAWLMQFDNGKKAPENPIWYWDADDNQRRYMLAGHKSRPISAVVSKDGKRFLTLDEGGTVIVWEGDRFEEKSRFSIGGAVQIALAPDGKTLAVLRKLELDKLGPGGTATSFDLFVFDATDPPAKPKPIWTTENHLDGTFTGPASLAFSPDGKTLYGAFGDPYPVDPVLNEKQKSTGVRVWELGTKIAATVPK